MVPRVSLGKCNDKNVLMLAKLCKKGKFKAGESIKLPNRKTYIVAIDQIHTYTKNLLGEVRKSYALFKDGEWHLKYRSVCNERGLYRRGVDSANGIIEDTVSLGGQQPFIRMADGTYMQSEFLGSPEVRATSEEIEKAIDYVKGRGSVDNYTKLLRDFRTRKL